jgi:cephalosporin-C deacetylase-like acetyl esterase/biopolymer transport protein ExbD
MSHVTRRELLRIAGAGAFGWQLLDLVASGRAGASQSLEPLNRFPRMVHEYFVRRVRQAERANLLAQQALKTESEARDYVQAVQAKIRKCFEPFPEKTPLEPKVTGVVERDAYKIENVVFESRPGFLVTANLYVPKGREFPLPGVVGTCGHSTNGKAAEAYQSFAQGLARQGYVCLIYDPIGQGERLQYPNGDLTSKIGPGVSEHLVAGNQQFLVGEFIGTWRAWDGIRALDYLLSRSEVDPNHVGVTGNSGGGTMTTWLCGLERRWTMAAPSCFVTTFRRNMENELPADTEQCPPRALALGLDHADFLAAMAPKPVIILAKERDYFDVRGVEEAYARLKRLYGLLGAEENIGLFVGPTYHGYSKENREAMYRWFNRATGISHAETEPTLVIEQDETLRCTPHGQVAELKSRPIHAFTRETSQRLAEARAEPDAARLRQLLREALHLPSVSLASGLREVQQQSGEDALVVGVGADGSVRIGQRNLTDEADLKNELQRLKAKGKTHLIVLVDPESTYGQATAVLSAAAAAGFSDVRLTAHRPRGAAPPYRILRTRGSRQYPTAYSITYAVETEPGVHAVVYRLSSEQIYSRPFRGKQRAVLYISHHSADAELRDEPLIRDLLAAEQEDAAFFTCDVRGIGDSRPDTCGRNTFLEPYGCDYFYAVHSLMLDHPYIGQKAYDVLRVLDWLQSVGHERVHIAAKGWGTLPATFAAVLSDRVDRVTLKNALTSYSAIAESETYDWPLSSFLHGVLDKFDLPDCYRELEKGKKLRQIAPWGPDSKTV